ncbi:MAG TPA: HAD family phosphatase [Anaerovoracaceae bacterium]|nr:HAD family phosphatase [Anaerovoracaceae bacterium]
MSFGAFEAILFDLDGVIIDTNKSVTDFWQRLAGRCQKSLTKEDLKLYVYGCQAVLTLDRLFPELDDAERVSVLRSLEIYESAAEYKEIPGVIQFLKRLKENCVTTALVTSAEQWKVDIVVKQLHLEGLFDAYITADDTKNGKPKPDCYLIAASRLDKVPQNCVVFEDAVSGVRAAVAAGAYCIGVNRDDRPLTDAGAIHVVPDFLDPKLPELIF